MIMFRNTKVSGFRCSFWPPGSLARLPAQQPPGRRSRRPRSSRQPSRANALAQAPARQPPGPVLNLQDASLTEVVDQLARQLKINIQIDPRVKGTITLNTYGETRNLDPRNLLDMILRVNGFGMVQEGEIYRIVPLADAVRQPMPFQVNGRDIPADDQLMLNLVFLKYVTVEELSKVMQEFTDANAVIKVYPPANLLFILDSRRNMRRLMELVALFDSDTFAGERVRLYELHNARPSDLVKELENILKSISLDSKNSTVRFLPVDRIGTLIAVAPNPGVFDTVETWIKKLDVAVSVDQRRDRYLRLSRSLWPRGLPGDGDESALHARRCGMARAATDMAEAYAGELLTAATAAAYRRRLWRRLTAAVRRLWRRYPREAAFGGRAAAAYGNQNSFNSGFGGAGGLRSIGRHGRRWAWAVADTVIPSFGGYAAQAPARAGRGARWESRPARCRRRGRQRPPARPRRRSQTPAPHRRQSAG